MSTPVAICASACASSGSVTMIGEAPAASSAFAVMSCTITFVMQWVSGCVARTCSMHWRTSFRNMRRRARAEKQVSTCVVAFVAFAQVAFVFVVLAQALFSCDLPASAPASFASLRLVVTALLSVVIMFPFASTI